jgi:hypothetical protein
VRRGAEFTLVAVSVGCSSCEHLGAALLERPGDDAQRDREDGKVHDHLRRDDRPRRLAGCRDIPETDGGEDRYGEIQRVELGVDAADLVVVRRPEHVIRDREGRHEKHESAHHAAGCIEQRLLAAQHEPRVMDGERKEGGGGAQDEHDGEHLAQSVVERDHEVDRERNQRSECGEDDLAPGNRRVWDAGRR